jgi:hypothetical protein
MGLRQWALTSDAYGDASDPGYQIKIIEASILTFI